MHEALAAGSDPTDALDAADIFDHVADQVCRSCAQWNSCWERAAEETYQDLCDAAAPIMARGLARKEDLPMRFRERCQRAGGFVTAVNQELDARLYRRQYHTRLAESRSVLAAQYQILGGFLETVAARQGRPTDPVINYQPDVAARASGRKGHTISGDRGASFLGPDATYYVLLCDGMGTGAEAARESTAAIRLLTQLLQAGMDAAGALQTLNGVYLLRDNGCFSTVDLLRINLTSADAILYKWGAAPSYLRHRRGLRRLGGASAPPGLGAGAEPEQIRLSLQHGEMLVLTTDGAGGPETERRIEGFDSQSPLEMAAYVLAGAQLQAEDDMTVAVVRLEPC